MEREQQAAWSPGGGVVGGSFVVVGRGPWTWSVRAVGDHTLTLSRHSHTSIGTGAGVGDGCGLAWQVSEVRGTYLAAEYVLLVTEVLQVRTAFPRSQFRP